MKHSLLSILIGASLSSCGIVSTSSPEASPGKQGEQNLFNSEKDKDSLNASVKKSSTMWAYKGSGDQSEGQQFCSLLAFVDVPNDFSSGVDRLDSLSDEQLSIYQQLQKDPSLEKVIDKDGKVVCEKVNIDLLSPQ